MDTAFISAFSALAGSIVGGMTSGFTNWMSLRSQARTGHRMHRVAQREDLYRDFIIAASEVYGKAAANGETDIQEAVVLYSMISRMRLLSSSEVVASAERTIDLIMDTKPLERRTILEHRALMKRGEVVDPLKGFSETTRREISRY